VTEALDARADLETPQELMVVVFAWNPGVLDGGLMEKIADSFGEFALKECQQKLS
jgi:hypothetical protein